MGVACPKSEGNGNRFRTCEGCPLLRVCLTSLNYEYYRIVREIAVQQYTSIVVVHLPNANFAVAIMYQLPGNWCIMGVCNVYIRYM